MPARKTKNEPRTLKQRVLRIATDRRVMVAAVMAFGLTAAFETFAASPRAHIQIQAVQQSGTYQGPFTQRPSFHLECKGNPGGKVRRAHGRVKSSGSKKVSLKLGSNERNLDCTLRVEAPKGYQVIQPGSGKDTAILRGGQSKVMRFVFKAQKTAVSGPSAGGAGSTGSMTVAWSGYPGDSEDYYEAFFRGTGIDKTCRQAAGAAYNIQGPITYDAAMPPLPPGPAWWYFLAPTDVPTTLGGCTPGDYHILIRKYDAFGNMVEKSGYTRVRAGRSSIVQVPYW